MFDTAVPPSDHPNHPGRPTQLVWVRDLDASRGFYERLGGRAGATYEDESVGLRSVLVRFPGAAAVELLELRTGLAANAVRAARVRVPAVRGTPGPVADPDGNTVEFVPGGARA